MTMSPLFELQCVSKYYKSGKKGEIRALDGLSFTIDPGDFVVLTGPSGSGKSTLLGLLGALERPGGGKIFFEGREMSCHSDLELARIRRRIGFVFQNFSLIPGLPIWENITYPLIPMGVKQTDRFRLAEKLLNDLGLQERQLSYPQELSGGECQRVALARALCVNPRVLLADEPTSNLDEGATGMLAGIFQKIHAGGTTIIMSSHDPSMAPLATKVLRLATGKLESVE